MTLEEFDAENDAYRLRRIERDLLNAEREGLAMQAALSEHPVVEFVKSLPVESPLYPAIGYLKQSDGRRRAPHGDTVQEGTGGDNRQETEDVQEATEPSERLYMEWCMPAHDLQRPAQKGCGFIRSKDGKGIVYTACPNDEEHMIKGKRRHCWSLRCPQCMNDTALRKGIAVERQLLMYRKLTEKKGGRTGDIGHWVVSPPQEFAKGMMQTRDDFDVLYRYVGDSMMSIGAMAGVTVFHPWRQREDGWKLSPHFHILCYGRLDTTRFRRDNKGWIIKKVHARERIRSIRHTASYIMTHMGLGLSERSPDECDWDLKLLDHMIPGLRSEGAKYSEKDYDDLSKGIGRMVGDLSDVDWVEWTKEELVRETRIRYWGGVARNAIVKVGNLRQYKIRVCKECGALLRTYDGSNDSTGAYVRYIQDNPVAAFAEDAALVRILYLRYKDALASEGLTIADFAAMIPTAASTLELGLPTNGDLVMDGPFEEPDEYFLRRQREATAER